MILSYPMVNENGDLNGAEVSFRLQDVKAVQQFTDWDRRRSPEGALIEGCSLVTMEHNTFEIKADYNELKELFKQWNEI